MPVSETFLPKIRPLPASPARGAGLPIAHLQCQGSASGDASGGTLGVVFDLPLGYALQPLWASWRMSGTPAPAPSELRLATGVRVAGVASVIAQNFDELSTQVTGSTFGNQVTWRFPPLVYIPDEADQVAHNLSIYTENANGDSLFAAAWFLAFDPADLQRGPMGGLPFFLAGW